MSQGADAEPLSDNLGYVLKQASAALHNAMDAALRPCGLSVSQYSCLELLDRQPGQTNAQLARGAFVTPQSMNDVLRGLQRRGLVTQPPGTAGGRARPTRLTHKGEHLLDEARAALGSVDDRMQAIASPALRLVLLDGLRAIIGTLRPAPSSAPAAGTPASAEAHGSGAPSSSISAFGKHAP